MSNGDTPEQAGVEVVLVRGTAPNRELIVIDPYNKPICRFELWAELPRCPHYHLKYVSSRFEFVRAAKALDSFS